MTTPQFGGLTGTALNPALMLVTDVFIAPWAFNGGAAIPYTSGFGASVGKFVPVGRIQNGSFKISVDKVKYQVKNGLPEVAIEEFTIGMSGKVNFNAIEITGKLFELTNGVNGLGQPVFGTPLITGTVAAQIPNPTPGPTVTTAATGGTVLAGTYLVAFTYKNASGETLISPEVPVTTTGTTSTITVTLPVVVPTIATLGANVYISAIGGATGSEKLQGNIAVAGQVFTLTTPPAAVTSVPGANTTGPATTTEFLNLTAATSTGSAPWLKNYFIQATTTLGTEYARVQAVTGGTTATPVLQLYPRLSSVPANGSAINFVDGFDVAAGGSFVDYYSFLAVQNSADGSQILKYVPKMSFSDTKDETPNGKEMYIPIEGMMFGVPLPSGYGVGPYLMRTITLSPRMALVYT